MNLPDKCPFCGAGVFLMADGRVCKDPDGSWIVFSCDTALHAGQGIRRTQSRHCEKVERDRLLARVAELEARCKRMEEALVSISEHWNRDNNQKAMEDACWHAVETAVAALTHEEAKP